MAVPPMAKLMDWFSVLLEGAIALIFHPALALLSFPVRQAPSDAMKRLIHWLRNSSVLCRWYSYLLMLLSGMWLHMLSASLLCSLAAHCSGSAVGCWFILFILCHVCIRCDIRVSAGVSSVSGLTAWPHIISCSVWLSTLM